MSNTVTNAFDWKAYTDEEHAKNGDPFAEIKRNALIGKKVSEGMQELRDKNPSHGTVHGITVKRLNIKPPEMMSNTGGARPNSGRKLPHIDERKALALMQEGFTKKEIAEKMRIPYRSILTFFKKKGLQKSRGEYAWDGKYVSKSKAA